MSHCFGGRPGNKNTGRSTKTQTHTHWEKKSGMWISVLAGGGVIGNGSNGIGDILIVNTNGDPLKRADGSEGPGNCRISLHESESLPSLKNGSIKRGGWGKGEQKLVRVSLSLSLSLLTSSSS